MLILCMEGGRERGVSFDCRICQTISFRYRRCSHTFCGLNQQQFHFWFICLLILLHFSCISMKNNSTIGSTLEPLKLITEKFISIVIWSNFDVCIMRAHHNVNAFKEKIWCALYSKQQLNQIDFSHLYWYRWPQIENTKHCLCTQYNV